MLHVEYPVFRDCARFFSSAMLFLNTTKRSMCEMSLSSLASEKKRLGKREKIVNKHKTILLVANALQS